MSLVSLLITILIAGLIVWLITLIPLPAPWGRIAQAVVAIVVLIWLLQAIGLFAGHVVVR